MEFYLPCWNSSQRGWLELWRRRFGAFLTTLDPSRRNRLSGSCSLRSASIPRIPGHVQTTDDESVKALCIFAVSSASESGPNQLAVYDSVLHTVHAAGHRALSAASLLKTTKSRCATAPPLQFGEYRPLYSERLYMRAFIQESVLIGAGEVPAHRGGDPTDLAPSATTPRNRLAAASWN